MGVYAVMLSLSRTLNVFQSSVAMVLFPKAAGQPLDAIVELTEVAVRISAMITALCAVTLCLIGPLFVGLLYGHPYTGAVDALRILLVEATLACTVTVMAQAFKAVGQPGVVTILQAIGLSLCIPLMLWFIPRWGLAGAAAALLISTMARFLFIYFSFRVFLRTRMPSLLPRLEDFRFILSVVHSRLRREPALPEIAQ
jgi:O-antigen/teichoic acid export membrane protein